MIYEVTDSNENKDIPESMSTKEARQYYLDMYGKFKSKLPQPEFYHVEERDDIFVLDFAEGPCGLKAYGAEKFIAELDSDLIGYAAPRVGHAPEAIAMLAEAYGKRAVFFAAASKQVTEHQAVVLGYKGCHLRFARIPAMPALNSWIRGWAEKFGGVALPFGLANTPMVTAGLVNTFVNHAKVHGEPPEFYCVVSTGTMMRAAQIAWPNAKAVGIAVARNIKAGEKGHAEVVSYHKSFYQDADYMPDFDTTSNYDAKAYRAFIDDAIPGSLFINVGSDRQISDRLKSVKDWQNIDAVRDWKDKEAFSKR